ncbi:MAG: carboxysome shell carbonic anhydrase [bacterium]
MLSSSRQFARKGLHQGSNPVRPAPLRRPGGVGSGGESVEKQNSAELRVPDATTAPVAGCQPVTNQVHSLVRLDENVRLADYEQGVKSAFDHIVPVLREISSLQHEGDFERRAQEVALREFGFELPRDILSDAWIAQLDMRSLYAWCTFQTYRRFCNEFFTQDPLSVDYLSQASVTDFEEFLQSCGFHTLDITPCSDGRLAHLIRYVLRLPHRAVRRKSYAGAMFDIEDNIQKWQEVELSRFREGIPNAADAPTRYLKMVVYHFSSVDSRDEGCAAHGSDDNEAARAGIEQLNAFREAIENSFCCGASIDLALIGLDTATDEIRVHVPDSRGNLSQERYIDSLKLYTNTLKSDRKHALEDIRKAIFECSPGVAEGMARLIEQLIENNFSQIAYVRSYHGQHYADIGHAERFIGAGVGFEEKQLRNLMFFAYLDTVEEATQHLDVGIKIFTSLNIHRGLPVPIVVRFDYHGNVPGARDRAMVRCKRVTNAIRERYSEQYDHGLLHIMQVMRDCTSDRAPIEVLGCTVKPGIAEPLGSGGC